MLLGFQATASICIFAAYIRIRSYENSWYCSALLLKHLKPTKLTKLHFADSLWNFHKPLEKNPFLDYFYHDKQPENCHGSPLRGPSRPGLQKHHGHSMLCALAISDHGSVYHLRFFLFRTNYSGVSHIVIMCICIYVYDCILELDKCYIIVQRGAPYS